MARVSKEKAVTVYESPSSSNTEKIKFDDEKKKSGFGTIVIMFLVIAIAIGGTVGIGKTIKYLDPLKYAVGIGEAGSLLGETSTLWMVDVVNAWTAFDEYDNVIDWISVTFVAIEKTFSTLASTLGNLVEIIVKINPFQSKYFREVTVSVIEKYPEMKTLEEIAGEVVTTE